MNALKAQNGIGNQSQVFNQLQGVANGTGPNPALAQLNQTTGQNIAGQAALMAGQRGANQNVGLIARQIGQQGAGIQQNAAGQAATLGAQQQLGALGQLGGLSSQQVAQQGNALNGFNQSALQGQQNILGAIQGQNNANIGATSNMNNVNAGVAAQQAQGQGGLLSGAASAFGPLSNLIGGIGGSASAFSPAAAAFSKGGTAEKNMKQGGPVPGKAKVAGDSPKNDTVAAKLSPGEIVIPRTITQHPDAVNLAAEFVKEQLEKHAQKKSNFDEGGTEVDDEPTEGQSSGGINPMITEPNPQVNFGSSGIQAPEGLIPTPVNGQYVPPAPTQSSIPTEPTATTGLQPNDPYGINTTSNLAQQGFQSELKGIGGGAAAAGNYAKESAKAYQAQAAQQKQAMDTYNQNFSQLQQQRQTAKTAYANFNVNPNRYLSNLGTAGNISTAIGLILGGIGSGITHQENPALKYLNDQINRDVDAQKTELGKRDNLLAANLKDFGNLDHATQMTRMQIADQISNQLGMAEAKYKGTQAGNNAALMRGQLEMKNAQTLGNLAAQKTQMDLARGPSSVGGSSGSFTLPAAFDPNRETRVEIGGQVFHANDKETADKSKPTLDAFDNITDNLKRIQDFHNSGFISGTSYPGTRRGGQADVLRNNLQTAIAQAKTVGGQGLSRLVDKVEASTPNVGGIMQSEAQGKIDELLTQIEQEKRNFIKNNLTSGYIPQTGKK